MRLFGIVLFVFLATALPSWADCYQTNPDAAGPVIYRIPESGSAGYPILFGVGMGGFPLNLHGEKVKIGELAPPIRGQHWLAFVYHTPDGDGLAALHVDRYQLVVLRSVRPGQLLGPHWQGPTRLAVYRTDPGAGSVATVETVALTVTSQPDPYLDWLVELHADLATALAALKSVRWLPSSADRTRRLRQLLWPGICPEGERQYQALVDERRPIVVDAILYQQNAVGSRLIGCRLALLAALGRQPGLSDYYYLRWNLNHQRFEQANPVWGDYNIHRRSHPNDGEEFGGAVQDL